MKTVTSDHHRELRGSASLSVVAYPNLFRAFLDEVAFQRLADGLRRLLRKVVAGIEGPARHLAGRFAPDRQQIAAIESPGVAAAPPHDQRRGGNLAAGLVIR